LCSQTQPVAQATPSPGPFHRASDRKGPNHAKAPELVPAFAADSDDTEDTPEAKPPKAAAAPASAAQSGPVTRMGKFDWMKSNAREAGQSAPSILATSTASSDRMTAKSREAQRSGSITPATLSSFREATALCLGITEAHRRSARAVPKHGTSAHGSESTLSDSATAAHSFSIDSTVTTPRGEAGNIVTTPRYEAGKTRHQGVDRAVPRPRRVASANDAWRQHTTSGAKAHGQPSGMRPSVSSSARFYAEVVKKQSPFSRQGILPQESGQAGINTLVRQATL
jgi:hypothetical protein